MKLRLLASLVALGAAFAFFAGQAEARKATPVERQAMLEVWNRYTAQYLDDPPVCRNTWVTRVSKYRPKIGMIWANWRLRVARGCTLGDGWVLLKRPSRKSRRWRIVTQGSEYPPCRYVTPRMARELGFPTCSRR